MRCLCCNHNLSDFEATARYKESNEFADLCTPCRKEVAAQGVEFITRNDLHDDEVEQEYENPED